MKKVISSEKEGMAAADHFEQKATDAWIKLVEIIFPPDVFSIDFELSSASFGNEATENQQTVSALVLSISPELSIDFFEKIDGK